MILHQALMFLLLSRMGCCFYHHVHSVENDHDDHAAPTDYSFSYGVKDYHSGDHKQHWEKKEGHIVRGGYSLLEPDGSIRSVDYTADPVNGFQAVVSKSASGLHPQPQHPETHPQFQYQQAHPPVQHQEQPQVNHQEQPQVNHQQHHIVYKEEDGGNYQQYGAQEFEHFIYLDGTGEESRVEETKSVTVLPVDPVAVLHSLQENVIPVDVTYVKPMEISLKHMKFVLETTKAPPKLERGFKPILATSAPDVSHSYSKPSSSQLYKSGKKPKTTPGLRNYASKRTRRIPVNNNRGNGRGPSQSHHQRRRFGR